MSNKIIPGILEKSWDEVEKKIQTIREFSNTIHIDFIDGLFSENLTFLAPGPFSKYKEEIFFEAHLMTDNPLQYLKPLSSAGFKRFLGHIERMPSQEEFVSDGQILGEVGLALDLKTTIDSIKVPLDDLDVVLLMTVPAGLSNQEFQETALEKISKLRSMTNIPIETDGGINEKIIILAKNAGANRFVSTSFITGNPDPKASFEKLSQMV